MTLAKANITNAILSGDPPLQENVASVDIVPGSLAALSSAGLLSTPVSGALWAGEIMVHMEELGQKYTGVFSEDSDSENISEAGDPVRFAIVGLNEDFLAYAQAGSADISIGDQLAIVTADDCGLVKKRTTEYGVAIALEDLAMSGLVVNTPIKCRRIMTGSILNSIKSLEAGITASVTQLQGGSPLTKTINEVATCANSGDSVTLMEIPDAINSYEQVVINNGATPLAIFPFLGADIGAGTNAKITVGPGSVTRFTSYSATKWKVG